MRVSFQIKESVTPFSITPFKMMTNHFAGIILLMICKGRGMLEIGKMNPDNKIVGSISPINEIIIAVCCVFEIVEIRIPNDKDVMMNNTLSNPNKK